LTITQEYYDKNNEKLSLQEKETFKIRKNLLEVVRESVGIHYANLMFVDEKMQDHLSEQMSKLKSYYLNQE